MMASEPMSDERLAELRQRVEQERGKTFLGAATIEGSANLSRGNQARVDREELLAEVERLRAREAALLVHQRATQEDIIEGRAREAALVARLAAAMAIVGAVARGGAPTRHANYLIFHETGPNGVVPGLELRKQARALLANSEEER